MFNTRRSARITNQSDNTKRTGGGFGRFNTTVIKKYPGPSFERKYYPARYSQRQVPPKGKEEVKEEIIIKDDDKEEQNQINQAEQNVKQEQEQQQFQQQQQQFQQQQFQQQQSFQPQQQPFQQQQQQQKESEMDDDVIMATDSPQTAENKPPENSDTQTSATTKALKQMEMNDGDKKKWKRGNKIPLSIRRQKLNQRLSKILVPKNALILLHELKPGCTYKIQEVPGSNPPLLSATAYHENNVLGTGQGMSKSQAKTMAAENAIKAIVSNSMAQSMAMKFRGDTSTDNNTEEKMDEDSTQNNTSNIPWAGLASFAIFKMFSEWQTQGTDLGLNRPSLGTKKKGGVKQPTFKKELPPDAQHLHPSVLLNMMRPGILATELEREPGPKGRVTVGYCIDGEYYKGVAGNRKDARREAAKAVLSDLYGLKYDS